MIVLAILIDLILLGIVAYGVYIGVKKGFVKIIGKPLISGVACGVVAIACAYGLDNIGIGHRLVTLVSIAAAGITYLVILLALKGLNEYDVKMMPKGEKLCTILDKLHVLEKGE